MSVGGGACEACGARKLQLSAAVGNHDNPVSSIHPGTISQLTNQAYLLYTVEPRLTTTLIIQSPCYYSHFFLAWQNGHTFSSKKPLLIWSPNSGIFYTFTPLIQPLIRNFENQNGCDMSISLT